MHTSGVHVGARGLLSSAPALLHFGFAFRSFHLPGLYSRPTLSILLPVEIFAPREKHASTLRHVVLLGADASFCRSCPSDFSLSPPARSGRALSTPNRALSVVRSTQDKKEPWKTLSHRVERSRNKDCVCERPHAVFYFAPAERTRAANCLLHSPNAPRRNLFAALIASQLLESPNRVPALLDLKNLRQRLSFPLVFLLPVRQLNQIVGLLRHLCFFLRLRRLGPS